MGLLKNIIVKPIVNQLPFCVFLYLIWGAELFVSLFSPSYLYSMKVFMVNLLIQPLTFLCSVFVYLYLFAFSIEYFKNKWFTSFVYGFVTILATIKWFLNVKFEMDFSPIALVLLAETNIDEAKEFIQTYVISIDNLLFFPLLICIVIFIYTFEHFYNREKYKAIKGRLVNSLFLFFLILGTVIYSFYHFSTILTNILENRNIDDLSKYQFEENDKICIIELLFSIYGVYLMSEEEESFENKVNTFTSDSVSCFRKNALNIVVVIGESYIKHHAGIYGYSLNTTPHLSEERKSGNLFVFNDVISPFSYTSTTIKNLLCTNSLSDGEKWSESYFFPQFFRAAGYEVYLWDNQKYLGDKYMFSFALNSFLYNKSLLSKVYNKTNTKSYIYDEDIINSFKSEKLSAKLNLVIFHLRGQHFIFKEKFPQTKDNIYFTVDSINRNEIWMTNEKKQLIADYDNATRYNDYVIWQILNLFRKSETIVVYFSDHGEEVYDYRNGFGRNGTTNKEKLKYIYQIPFMIWCSDSYIRNNPDHVRDIESAKDKPFMIDNLCHLLFDLGSIKTKHYHAGRNILSPIFKPHNRIISDNLDYDSIMGQ